MTFDLKFKLYSSIIYILFYISLGLFMELSLESTIEQLIINKAINIENK